MAEQYILGSDLGTDSVRAVVVNAESGKEEAKQVAGICGQVDGSIVPGLAGQPAVPAPALRRVRPGC